MLLEAGIGPRERRSIEDILGFETGPSPRGSTYWSRYLHCPREHALGNILGWKPEYLRENLTVGILFHLGLETYYKYVQQHQETGGLEKTDPKFFHGAHQDAAVEAFRKLQPVAQEEGYEETYAVVERCLDAYFKRWQSDRWEVIDVEPTVFSKYRHGIKYSARLDLFVIDHGQNPAVSRIIEHKTAYRLDGFILEGYTQDLQVLGQIWLATHEVELESYPTFIGSLVNVVSKTKEPGTERIPVSPSPQALEGWREGLAFHASLAPRYEALGWPQNFGSCVRRFGRCDFWEFCRTYPGLSFGEISQMEPPTGYKKRLPVVYEEQ